MAHYYNEVPESISKPIYFETYIDNIKIKVHSDAGVFSNKYVDFGTKVLLNSFNIEETEYKSILDLGCGYGVIGIFLQKKYPESNIELVDINERAVELANKNIIENNVSCVAYKSDGFSNVKNKFDLICLNPPIRAGKKVYYKMYNDAKNFLNKNGEFRIVIQKKQGALSSYDELIRVFGNCKLICREKGYQIYQSILTD